MITAAGAILGPLYAQAAGESTLRDTVTQANVTASGLQLRATKRISSAVAEQLSLKQIESSFAVAPAAGSLPGYPSRIEEVSVHTAAAAMPVSGVALSMVWRQGVCEQLTLTAGRCPTAAGEALVSARTAGFAPYGWRLGGELSVATGQKVRIVGEYRPKNTQAAFWFGTNYFDTHPNATGADSVDSIFVTRGTFDQVPAGVLLRGSVDYVLNPAEIRLTDVPTVRSSVAALQRRLSDGSDFVVTTGIASVLDLAAHQRSLVDVGAGIVTAQLAVLGWMVLFLMMADAVESRGAEFALAKLRGLSPPEIWRFGLAEPVAVLAVAMPFGGALGYLGASAFSAVALAPDTPVVIPGTAPLAVLAVFLGGLVAAIMSARRAVARPVLEQWRRTAESSTAVRGLLVAEVSVSVLAAVGLVVLRADPGVGSLVLLAPGLLVVAVALFGSRLIPRAARLLIAPTRSTARLGLFLASRQVARRPAGLRLAALLAVAVGLSCFGVAGETVAVGNRAAIAQAELGADSVVSIQYDPAVDPVAAVRRADPDGRWAAAAATWSPDGGSISGTVLGVDSARLEAVGDSTRGGPGTAALVHTIASDTFPAVLVTGNQIHAVIAASGITASAAPLVQFNLVDSRGADFNAESAALRDGRHAYSAPVDCTRGCTLVGVTWDRPITVQGRITGTATVTGLAVRSGGGEVDITARLHRQRAWRAATSEGEATDRVSIDQWGVTDRFEENNGGYGGIAYAYTPDPIPIVATPSAIMTGTTPGDRNLIDGFGASAPIRIVHLSPVLPVVLGFGAVADLTALRAQLPAFSGEAVWQVWLSPSAPADAIHRLREAGLTVQGTTATIAAREAEFARQAPALSLLLLLIAAVIGTILAMGATAVSIAATARRRSYEMAALRVIRVSWRHLYRASVIENAMLLGGAAILGLPTGIVAALIALPVLPEFATPPSIPLDFGPQPLPLIVFAVVFAILVATTALAAAAAVIRMSRMSRLREGEE